MHHGGIFYLVKKRLRAKNRLNTMRIAAIHAVIDKRDIMRRASFFLEQVIAFGTLPAQIDNGLYALAGQLSYALGRGLIFAAHPAANIVVIGKIRAQKPVIVPC